MTAETTKNKKHQNNTVFKDFDTLTFQAIDDALSALGEQPKKAIYSYLKGKYNISKKDVPHRIEDFSKALEDLLQTGGLQLEILCMKNLCAQIKKKGDEYICEWTPAKSTIQEYVQFLKQQYKEEK